MELQKKITSFLLLLITLTGFAQEPKSNLFLRTPQTVNYNINESDVVYTSVISIGIGLSHKSEFIELATFINEDGIYGFYTFFGTTLKIKEIKTDVYLHTHWFGLEK